MFEIFKKECEICGEFHVGPREGRKARGMWLGYGNCPKCREEEIMKKLTQQELDEAIELHGKWLRKEKGGVKLDLSDLDLAYVDLAYLDLTGANFTRANLRYANLTRADLTCANFTRANLRGANLTRADLRNTNFTDAGFTSNSSTDLTSANFTDAGFTSSSSTNPPCEIKAEEKTC